jgi:hypothetical protein
VADESVLSYQPNQRSQHLANLPDDDDDFPKKIGFQDVDVLSGINIPDKPTEVGVDSYCSTNLLPPVGFS